MTPKVAAVILLWIVLVFSPHWFLVARGAPASILRLQSFLPAAVGVAVLLFDWQRLRILVPLFAYAAYVVLYTYWFASYPAVAEPDGKQMVVVMILAVATLTLVRHPYHIRTIVLMMLLYQFAWYGLIGVGFGGVRFDPYLANEDGFGAHMAIGAVASSAIALASTDRRLRWAAVAVALLSVAGVISSFARGAFLATVLGTAFLWIRADGRRLSYIAFLAAIALATLIVAGSFSNVARGRQVHESYWGEIATIRGDIADTEAEDRRFIWRIGWQVFEENRAFGAGPGSWSTYACTNYAGLPILGERFARRPERLCGHAMHNIFIERLADLGLVGTSLFLLILLDYWRRILAVRRRRDAHDASIVPGLRTQMIATAFEASMVTLLFGGILYNSARTTLYALVIANALFHLAWLRTQGPLVGTLQRRAGRRARRGPAITSLTRLPSPRPRHIAAP